ncbi:hypothetical protein Aduo_015995 [Ancylostoma duodenale]
MTSDRATFSAASGPAADHQQEGEMCGIMQGGLCRFSELTPGQFGLTKQLSDKEYLTKAHMYIEELHRNRFS